MTASFDRELKVACMDLADRDYTRRLSVLSRVKELLRTASTEKKQDTLVMLNTKLSGESNADVKRYLLELNASWTPSAAKPATSHSRPHLSSYGPASIDSDDMGIELEVYDDEPVAVSTKSSLPAPQRSSSNLSASPFAPSRSSSALSATNTSQSSSQTASQRNLSSHSIHLPQARSEQPYASHPPHIDSRSLETQRAPSIPTHSEPSPSLYSRPQASVSPALALSSTSSMLLTTPTVTPIHREPTPPAQSLQLSSSIELPPPAVAKNAFGMMMSKKRPAVAASDIAPTSKRPKKVASTMQSKYTPSNPADFLANRHALGSPAPIASSAPMVSSHNGAIAYSGYTDLGMPATYSAPVPPRSNIPSLGAYSRPQDMMPQRSIGAMAPAPQQATPSRPLPSTFYAAAGTSQASSGSKVSPFATSSRSNSTSTERKPYGPTVGKTGKTAFNNRRADTGGSRTNSIGSPRPMDLTKVDYSPSLSANQKLIVEKALRGESFFFTGAAGTGKSFVLKEIIRIMKEHYSPEELQIVAPTGMAAVELGGWTINAFAGIGLGEEKIEELEKKVNNNIKSRNRWRQSGVLIIDEVSMLGAALFDKLERIACTVRGRGLGPFGGLQLVMCGDFFQLPPVTKNNSLDPPTLAFMEKVKKYAFESDQWKACVPNTYTLTEVFRQVGDASFVAMLNEIRLGKPSPATIQALNSRIASSATINSSLSRGSPASISVTSQKGAWQTKELAPAPIIEPTRLFSKKNEVLAYNMQRLRLLPGNTVSMLSEDKVGESGNTSALKTLADHCPATRSIEVKIGAQVVLIRNKATLGLVNGSRGTVAGFVDHAGVTLPLVQFESNDGVPVLIERETWTVEQNGVIMAQRAQVPLTLAWALSIHKSQGMTISEVEVSLDSVFEDGQAYVALSRVTSLEGLKISRPFNPRVIRANDAVLNFYNSLQRV